LYNNLKQRKKSLKKEGRTGSFWGIETHGWRIRGNGAGE
jgi:hypothetical protein